MRTLVAALAALALSGCVVLVEKRARPEPVKQQKAKPCPPGHTWSDGQCHGKGKGHDPAKSKG